ncbi:hypothetical protein EDC96DRAFT_304935 [Choanephora cucurbitarum]|nr:hypothetical protein EDC96DRAFT_304935 [Choanephora cucurbitarum]
MNMFTLSHLPIEILYLITDHLAVEDIVILARLNSWYSYWLSFILGERIHQQIDQEGWRIHLDILATSYPVNQHAFSHELVLLSNYTRISPTTLMIELNLCPVAQNGFDLVYDHASTLELLHQIKTNIDMVAYVAQVSSEKEKKLQYVHQAGAAMLSEHQVWKQSRVVLGSDFHVKYQMRQEDPMLIQHPPKATLSFGQVQISPEWWVKQLNRKTLTDHHELVEHQYW